MRRSVVTARRNLEGILTYAVTQLVMWLSKPDFDPSTAQEMDVEADSNAMAMDASRSDSTSLKERTRGTRTLLTMAERLRRGMTSEIASDLKALLNRANPIVTKSATIWGKDSVDIVPVLVIFLQDHINITT